MRKVYYYLYKSSFNERLFISEYFDDISKANESRNEHIKNNPGDMVLPISEGFIESFVKFVSYTGKWPCLCGGDLHLEIEGEPVVLSHVIHSNGSVVQKGGDYVVTKGKWKVDIDYLPEKYKKYAKVIENLANKYIEKGCCGGCI